MLPQTLQTGRRGAGRWFEVAVCWHQAGSNASELRPIYHRRQERIWAHVLLCWLSLLLIWIAENGTGQTWHRLRCELEKMHLGRFSGRAGLVHQRTEATTAQRAIFTALALEEPPRFFHLEAADSVEST